MGISPPGIRGVRGSRARRPVNVPLLTQKPVRFRRKIRRNLGQSLRSAGVPLHRMRADQLAGTGGMPAAAIRHHVPQHFNAAKSDHHRRRHQHRAAVARPGTAKREAFAARHLAVTPRFLRTGQLSSSGARRQARIRTRALPPAPDHVLRFTHWPGLEPGHEPGLSVENGRARGPGPSRGRRPGPVPGREHVL